ncbi:MAG: gamma-glutamyltranspeptidase / glutathione hydrolase [Kribbellaceae bacterium]|nr:gamma-glutamyltranspeptidase / glutathione hydrolase [Kribbellaceae bacterium]
MRVPSVTRYAPRAMVSTVDHLATEAGLEMLRRGGNAVDAALAANAVITVTLPNQCGLGGDLFALVRQSGEAPVVLNASGRSGSGADPDSLRAEGLADLPHRHDVRSATIPGCVDGWVALHERYSRLSLEEILEPAIRYALDGFPASPYLVRAVPNLEPSTALEELAPGGAVRAGQMIRRPGAGRLLSGVATAGRSAFYEGEFGQGLVALGCGLFAEEDLRQPQADWVTPASLRVWGHDLWTPPPNSQGYLALSAAWIAERLDLPSDPDDPLWAHLLIEAARHAAYDRPEVLHADADARQLLAPSRLLPRVANISRHGVADLADRYGEGGTTYLCVVDESGMAVSLIQSNGMSFGSRLTVGQTGVWLHNRGFAFSLVEGHPAEYGPQRRPPHTLSPILITKPDGDLFAALGTRGGDSQPQIMLQLITRLLMAEQDPATALAAGRWVLRGAADESAFNTWGYRGSVRVALEGQAPTNWADALTGLGHRVEREAAFGHAFGHAQIIVAEHGRLAGAADPRALAESAAGF